MRASRAHGTPVDAPVGRPVAGRYLLLDPIARGGMSSVWRAWDLRERRHVAAKVLARVEGDLLLRFVQEQATRVDHPHVLTPTGWAADDDRVLLVMELVRGGSVGTLARDHGRPLHPSLVAGLLDQLLAALAAVHAAGIVHRDVKPANLLLDPTSSAVPRLRLADFGVAVRADAPRLTSAPGVVGTDGYVAPEVGAGARPAPAQDLYAAGVVAGVLLGRPATAGAPVDAGPLGELVTLLTAPDPLQRLADAETARALLARVDLPPPPPGLVVPDRLGPDPAPPAQRDWLPTVAVLGSAAAVTVAGIALRLSAG